MRKDLRTNLEGEIGTNTIEQSIGSVYGIAITARAEVEVTEKENAKDYKYKFAIILDDEDKTEISIPVSDIQESKLEKDFENATGQDDLRTLFGNNADVREKRRELTASFAKIMGRVTKPFVDLNQTVEILEQTLIKLSDEKDLLDTVLSTEFTHDSRYKYLMRRRRELDKRLLHAANDDHDPRAMDLQDLNMSIA